MGHKLVHRMADQGTCAALSGARSLRNLLGKSHYHA
jgi:hypothetical protein